LILLNEGEYVSNPWEMKRRTFLQGLGISIALPVLDAMVPSMAKAATAGAPRFAAIYIPTGIYGGGYDATKNAAARGTSVGQYGTHRYFLAQYPGELSDPGPNFINATAKARTAWNPQNTGPLTAALPPILAPLEALKNQLTIISGLSLDPSVQHGAGHAWLCDIYGDVSPRTTLDQEIANYFNYVPGSTIVFNPRASGDPSFEAISYNKKLGGTSKVPVSTDAKAKFNSLFGSCNPTVSATLSAQQINGKSVLDYVSDSISAVQKKLGKDDIARMDAYLTNVRELEKNLTALPMGTTTMGCPSQPVSDPANSSGPLAWVTNENMMIDVMALALASDAMPIATMMLDHEGYQDSTYQQRVAYASNFIGVDGGRILFPNGSTEWHLDVAHHANQFDCIEQCIALNQYEISYFKRLVQKMGSMPLEPNGNTPLDNSIIMSGAGLSDGSAHSSRNQPLVFAGGKKYGMQKGHIAFPLDTNMGNLLFTLMQTMGVNNANFNGYSKKLSGIFG
jgi:hypothetical protein